MLPLILATLLAGSPSHPLQDLPDKSRVVFLGGTLIEREQKSGGWEHALLRANPGKSLVVRNLGWSGETVFGDARAGFDTARQGYERMIVQTRELKPTVIVLAFGQNELAEGIPAARFAEGYQKLLADLAPLKAKCILLTPLTPARLVGPPGAAREYLEAIRRLAESNHLPRIDLSTLDALKTPGLSDNGLHLTPAGYQATAAAVVGVPAPAGDAELREAIIAKNRQFFFLWRPQNITYLFGFRKHEQGKNAVELNQFDGIIREAEVGIDALLARPPAPPAAPASTPAPTR